ncbi:MAG TPA: L-histidine N(alpha)-methyltransferase [Gallionellaceae bacterium]|nr:L-histidine N(alpha)-methyltransferase [Gallionellaceae bacterium]
MKRKTSTIAPAQAAPDASDFLDAVRDGLRRRPRSIPPKYFYDARGSELFDLICETPEYYPTRTETGILERFGARMAELCGASCVLIELGSGSATKTPLLLRHLAQDAVYMPIEICAPHLEHSTQRLRDMFPAMRMRAVCADYTRLPALPLDDHAGQRRVVFFPGSTIGNCTPDEARALLRQAAQLTGKGGALLIGVDCKKSPQRLNSAYNDGAGHTAAFNINLLHRMRRELGAELDPEGFEHYAYYNAGLGRMEMHLVSRRRQQIRVGGESFDFESGDTIHTENSYKYAAHEFEALAREAGWHPKARWTDRDGLFNVHYLSLSAAEPTHLPQHTS